jgi:hypothetical protein
MLCSRAKFLVGHIEMGMGKVRKKRMLYSMQQGMSQNLMDM